MDDSEVMWTFIGCHLQMDAISMDTLWFEQIQDFEKWEGQVPLSGK